MTEKEIIKIIKTKHEWNSVDLIKLIKEASKNEICFTFCHIGGYELMKDGTQTDICRSLKDIQNLLTDWDIEYDKTIKDPKKLVQSIESEWANSWDHGGGSGWIKY